MEGAKKSCCTPAREVNALEVAPPMPLGEGAKPHAATPVQRAMVQIPACTFLMGTDSDEGFPEDGEGPSRMVSLSAFSISPTAVTNREFAEFVRATRYVTDAERMGSSFVFYLQVDEARRKAVRATPTGLPWWIDLADACWQRPEGPGSHLVDRQEHPVVHVSWNDCIAYCAWSGTRLPTEAEWECAARGGLHAARYPWGDELRPSGQAQNNIWQGDFPNSPAGSWRPGTLPVASFEPNGFGLYQCSGNVWEWCADLFDPACAERADSPDPRFNHATGLRSMRGGSFLCHDSYCNRYRTAARGSSAPMSSATNIGFRVLALGNGMTR